MEEDKDNVKIRAINITLMMEALETLFSKGVDYIDIHQSKEDEDTLVFYFTKDYINEKYRKSFEEEFGTPDELNEPKETIRLTQEDINKLL